MGIYKGQTPLTPMTAINTCDDWLTLKDQPLTLTLTHSQWETIRLAALFSSSDARHGQCEKNLGWADQAFDAYRALRQEMGLDSV